MLLVLHMASQQKMEDLFGCLFLLSIAVVYLVLLRKYQRFGVLSTIASESLADQTPRRVFVIRAPGREYLFFTRTNHGRDLISCNMLFHKQHTHTPLSWNVPGVWGCPM